jgi:hypothetical protein
MSFLTTDLEVLELKKLGISGFSYCSEAVSDARKAGVKLVTIVQECDTY